MENQDRGTCKPGVLNVKRCNIVDYTWNQLSNPSISGRGGAGFLPSADNNSLFVVGGFTGKESNSVYRFDLIKEIWEVIYEEDNDVIKPFSVSAGILQNNNLIFFGGEIDPSLYGHLGAGNFSNYLLILDGLTGKKLNEAKYANKILPLPRGWFDATKWNNKMVIFGGLSGNDKLPIRLNDTWVLETIYEN